MARRIVIFTFFYKKWHVSSVKVRHPWARLFSVPQIISIPTVFQILVPIQQIANLIIYFKLNSEVIPTPKY